MTNEMILKYADSYEGKCSESNRKYWKSQLYNVLQFGDYLIGVIKDRIETRFCFSYDEYQDCQTGSNTYKQAHEQAKNVNYDYFLKENLEFYDRKIENIEKNSELYLYLGYYNNNEIVDFCDNRTAEDGRVRVIRKMTEEEKQLLLKEYKKAKESMEKRCATWWKKYGRKHLTTWTYSCWD